MHDSVRRAFTSYSETFEGKVPWMYLDVKGLVTTAIGNLIDPGGYLTLPWRHFDGSLATAAEIEAEWQTVKSMQWAKLHGGASTTFRRATTLRLDDAGIDQCVQVRLGLNEAHLVQRFPQIGEWPADAQLAVHSLSWACGPAFRYPKLQVALLAQDFVAAQGESDISAVGNPGVIPRNAAQKLLLQNAAWVKGHGLDPSILYYPSVAKHTVPLEAYKHAAKDEVARART